MIPHRTLLYIDHEIATAIADPRLIPADVVVLFIDKIAALQKKWKYTQGFVIRKILSINENTRF